MAREKFLITGASGCIGSAVLRQLTDEGADFIASDVARNLARPRLLLSDAELEAMTWLDLDVTDAGRVTAMVRDHAVTHIVHLAGLTIPFARADPPRGAQVNVTGTVNILEAARLNDVRGLSYASSTAVYGPSGDYPAGRIPEDAPLTPRTLYGVYKVANEETARIYWQDWQVGSVGLRPGVVYGVGRDQGVSADPAKALLAIAADRPFHIKFDGPITLQYTGDVARMFVEAARSGHQGAATCNLRNDYIEVSDFVALLRDAFPDARITFEEGAPLPVAFDLADGRLERIIGDVPHKPLAEVIRQEVAAFRDLLRAGKVDPSQLEA